MRAHEPLYDSSTRRILAVAWAVVAVVALALGASGCASEAPASGWGGTVDTLSSGQVSAYNPVGSLWSAGDEWVLQEDLRIGTRRNRPRHVRGDHGLRGRSVRTFLAV